MSLIYKKKPLKQKDSWVEVMRKMSWCIKNNIIIYYEPISWREGRIVINDNGKPKKSEETYFQVKLKLKDKRYHEVVYENYVRLYNEKNNIKDEK